MRGPKRNEGATAVGERSGTKAVAKHVRSSAYKARVVLDLIRGLDVRSADEVLQLTDRGIARDIRKVLASAVANATDADSGAYVADADELFVIACFADEGPTLRRFKPRARGRATRIRKRTCHITVIVARMSDERIEIIQARAEGAGQAASASRAARVERSRAKAQEAKEALDAEDQADGEVDEADASAEDLAADAADDDASADDADTTDADTTDDGAAEDGATEVQAFADSDDDASDDDASDAASSDSAPAGDGEYGAGEWAGSVLPDADGNGPESHPIKGNADSMLYHVPGSRYYKVTKAEVWFDTEANAEAAGFSQPGASNDDSGDDK